MHTFFRLCLSFSLLISTGVSALSLEKYPQAARFVQQMTERHGFDRDGLAATLAEARIKQNILAAIQRPAEAKPWHEYRKIFLTERRISDGVEFWQRHLDLLQRAEQTYGVPPAIIVAILGVETFYGTRTGSFRVLDALSTLAFAYPRRADFFVKELEHFFLLTREERLEPREPLGSYAGAMGWPQFMPSSFRSYAMDFDGDGKRDIWDNPADVIASVANYFARHGWQTDEPVTTPLPATAAALANGELKAKFSLVELGKRGLPTLDASFSENMKANVFTLAGERGPEVWLGFPNFYVITRYNRSRLYAMAVFQLSEKIRARVRQTMAVK